MFAPGYLRQDVCASVFLLSVCATTVSVCARMFAPVCFCSVFVPGRSVSEQGCSVFVPGCLHVFAPVCFCSVFVPGCLHVFAPVCSCSVFLPGRSVSEQGCSVFVPGCLHVFAPGRSVFVPGCLCQCVFAQCLRQGFQCLRQDVCARTFAPVSSCSCLHQDSQCLRQDVCASVFLLSVCARTVSKA